MGPFQRLVAWVSREEDDSDTLFRKKFVLTAAPALVVLGTAAGYVYVVCPGPKSGAYISGAFGCVLLVMFLLFYLCCTRTLPQRTMEVAVALMVPCMLLGDWAVAAGRHSPLVDACDPGDGCVTDHQCQPLLWARAREAPSDRVPAVQLTNY
eukprot:TRINITY_DN72006_c0_g1_i1.p1 TRINITY_DN72006_c0_g1~~TRINITY_DN72006_c0_g1_i1.p1  ORF type:complete len:152 (+),score=13.43 TRINITY_DN72006_c0_g1_i1:106-561(+)